MEKEELGTRILELMDYYGLSQKAFAARIGVVRSSVTHLIGGRNAVRFDTIVKILEAFPQLNARWFLLGIGEIELPQSPDRPGEGAQCSRIATGGSSEQNPAHPANLFSHAYSPGEGKDDTADVAHEEMVGIPVPLQCAEQASTEGCAPSRGAHTPVVPVDAAGGESTPSPAIPSEPDLLVLLPDGTYRRYVHRNE